ncbi:hypothetical protein PCANB_002912 [Pneumocystis canis]|nr:hypothetical protein PCANB_002912 [Pneumocystis canis]
MILKNSPLITRLSIFLTTILFFIHISLKFLINLLNPLLFLKEEYSELPFMVIIPGLLYYGGRYLEKSWGSRSLIKFILIITIIPNILTWAWYIMRYIIERKIFFLTKSIHGGYALYSGFLVALKQLIPEHTVTLFKGILRIRIKSEGLLSNFQHNSDFFPHLNTSRFEAERRRAFALKALEQRLNSLENSKSNIESTTIESAVSTIEFSNQSSITDDTNKNQNNPGK